MNTVIVIVGATATGKTETAIELAKKTAGGEIISADSRQVYKFLNIGTNKPSKSQLKKAAHHLIDIIEATEDFSAGSFIKLANKKIQEIIDGNRIPIVTGGTGFYAKSLAEGLIDVPGDAAIREKLLVYSRKYGTGRLFKKLLKLDPETAKSIDKNNTARLIRALEICLSTGKKFSDLKKHTEKSRYNFMTFGLLLPREEIYRRINERVDSMIKKGLVAETKKLVKKYSSKNIILNTTIGYKEIIGYFEGKYPLKRAVELIKQNTRHYAKRQLTWFKKDKNILWVDADKTPAEKILNCAEKSCIIATRGKKKGNFSRCRI